MHIRVTSTQSEVKVKVKVMQVGWLEFNVPFQHKYGYIRDENSGVESYPLTQ